MPKSKSKKMTESKQDFLKRCAAEAVATGSSESQALAACAAEWNRREMSAFVDDGRLTLSAPVELAAADKGQPEAARRFSILAYTGKLIDWGYWGRFIIDLSGMQLAKAKVPSLLNHDRRQIVGTIDQGSGDTNGFCVAGTFSRITDAAAHVLGLADEGFPWQASVGVQAGKIMQLAKDATMQVNGQTVTGPCDVWLESHVFEVSFCPFGADDETAAVSMAAKFGGPDGRGEVVMNKKLRAYLETLGLAPEATEQEALVFMAGLDPEVLAKESAPGSGLPVEQPRRTLSAEEVVRLQDNARNLGIVDVQAVNKIAVEAKSLQEANSRLVELSAKQNPPVGGHRFESGRTEAEKVRLAMGDALAMRCNVSLKNPAPGAMELRGYTLRELAREYLERTGVSTRGLDNQTLAGAALGVVRLAGMQSASDFPSLLQNVAGKILMKAYTEVPSTWQAWCGVGNGSDFKDQDRVQLSEAPSLELINEAGEYTYAGFSDFKETNRIRTYGRKMAITRQAIINDDLGALQRIPRSFGAAAVRRINDLVYAVLTGNQVMSYDGKALFHADHGNLGAAGGLASDTLSKARKAMRTQTGPGGAALNISPRYLIVPAAQETAADVLLRSVASTDNDKNAGVVNPWQNALIPVTEARLDADSEKAFYLAADPSQVDTVEVMFLDGVQHPVIEETDSANIDGREYKVRIDVGVRALDHRGLYKNPGA